ncbi:BNR repeat-containing protein [Amycolatopsis sp. SID8362]|uniref:BNR repeat-containing protein n=1 Tax=Amycolatopsis sp. SID8362 TaxID=2690346 RepID=UPI00136B84BA|nr:BNR repeat-containing protein [Amycolatopsis sp. SID8362]NBH08433.1 Tat pathway signal sequence domain protein [Amycolatopsis sp. SID8362]NED45127.1 Tat pathway signal sequence domain protein [Amycolatopsis sp. SID8362]
MAKRALSRILGVLAAAVIPLLPATPAEAAVAAVKIGDTQLDPAALYFVSYDGLVNNDSFQQSGIFSYAGYQYAAWYTADRSAVLARRPAAGAWQTLVLPHKLTVDDSHNVISMGVSPEDGRLHVAMDTHGNQVYYTGSEAGLLSSPSSHAWTASAFGPVQRTLDGVDLGAITYPQFVVTPERKLQLSYRTGGSGNGVNELAEYSGGSWRKLGKWTSATGSWTSGNGVTSTTRNMYLHGLTYGPGGRLHAAFTWREGNTGVLCNAGGLANHDTGYVYSDDRGRSWRTSSGAAVTTPVSVSTPGTVVDPLGVDHGLMNQESQAVDSAGQPHVVISYVPGRFTQCVTDYSAQRKQYGRTFFLSRAAGGTWTKREVPVAPESTQRTKLVFDRADNAYLVMPYGRIVAATKASGWTDWKTVYTPDLRAFGEVDVDDSRLATDGVLSVMYQQVSTGTTPSPIRVADFRLG